MSYQQNVAVLVLAQLFFEKIPHPLLNIRPAFPAGKSKICCPRHIRLPHVRICLLEFTFCHLIHQAIVYFIQTLINHGCQLQLLCHAAAVCQVR